MPAPGAGIHVPAYHRWDLPIATASEPGYLPTRTPGGAASNSGKINFDLQLVCHLHHGICTLNSCYLKLVGILGTFVLFGSLPFQVRSQHRSGHMAGCRDCIVWGHLCLSGRREDKACQQAQPAAIAAPAASVARTPPPQAPVATAEPSLSSIFVVSLQLLLCHCYCLPKGTMHILWLVQLVLHLL